MQLRARVLTALTLAAATAGCASEGQLVVGEGVVLSEGVVLNEGVVLGVVSLVQEDNFVCHLTGLIWGLYINIF